MARTLDLSLEGSLADGRFSRYVPPVAYRVLNGTPTIATGTQLIHINRDALGGVSWRLHDNAIMGSAFDCHPNESAHSLFEWRSMFDVAIHF